MPEVQGPEGDEWVGLVIVAAGESRRMAGVDKIFTPLVGLPLIAHTVEIFEAHPMVRSLVLVLPPEKVEMGRSLAQERGWRKLAAVCAGGARRQDSVRLGLERLGPTPWVAIHDGARPCAGTELLNRGMEAARETGAAVAAVPAKDTIKVVSPAGLVLKTPPRDGLWLVQTPQVFRYDLLMQAHGAAQQDQNVTDDSELVEAMGNQVKVFMGSYDNLKVTTSEDLAAAEQIIMSRA